MSVDQEWVRENIDLVMKEFLKIHPQTSQQNKSKHKRNLLENADTRFKLVLAYAKLSGPWMRLKPWSLTCRMHHCLLTWLLSESSETCASFKMNSRFFRQRCAQLHVLVRANWLPKHTSSEAKPSRSSCAFSCSKLPLVGFGHTS